MKALTPDIIAKYKLFLRNNPDAVRERSRKQYVLIIEIILTLFALSFFLLFAILPTFETITNLKKQLADNKVVDQSLRTKLDAMTRLSEQYSALGPTLNLINNAVPADAQLAKLTRQIETLVTQHQLVLDRLSFGSVEIYPANKTSSPIYSISFTVSVSGSDSETKNFIYDLISFERIINLDKVSSGSSEEKGSSSTIVGRAFFRSVK